MKPMKHHRGQAFLALILVAGITLVLAAGTIVVIVGSFANTSYGNQAVATAQAAATAGAEDALLRLERNPASFSSPGYTVTTNAIPTTVSVARDTPLIGEVTIIATAASQNRTRKLKVVVSENTLTNEITRVFWGDIP